MLRKPFSEQNATERFIILEGWHKVKTRFSLILSMFGYNSFHLIYSSFKEKKLSAGKIRLHFLPPNLLPPIILPAKNTK